MDWKKEYLDVIKELNYHYENYIRVFIEERDGSYDHIVCEIKVYKRMESGYLYVISFPRDEIPNYYFVLYNRSQKEAIEVPRPEIINEERKIYEFLDQ